jgi:mRNA interferase MazF
LPTFETTQVASLRAGQVVRVPFPYTDGQTLQRRPALVVAAFYDGDVPALLWVLMITSAENRIWPGDVPIRDIARAGLPVACTIRTRKLATIDAARAEALGSICPDQLGIVVATITGCISGMPPAM